MVDWPTIHPVWMRESKDATLRNSVQKSVRFEIARRA